MFWCSWAGLIAVVALVAVPAGRTADAVRARVQGGTLLGVVAGDVRIFKGIPYAAPPVGPLRSALPQPVVPWTRDRAADDFGAWCLQSSSPRNGPPGSRGQQLSEDCLTLNVWAPQAARKAPVMVWIHGGGNQNGSHARPLEEAAALDLLQCRLAADIPLSSGSCSAN